MKDLSKYYIFGRWAGDGCRTDNMLIISRDNTPEEQKAMQIMAKNLKCQTSQNKTTYVTRFLGQKILLEKYKKMYKDILSGSIDFTFFTEEQLFAMAAGFLDSDGTVSYNNPNSKGSEISTGHIIIEFYNNELFLLNFFKDFFKSKGLVSFIIPAKNRKTNMGIDKCNRLKITCNLSNYFLGYKLLPYLLHKLKKDRISKWIALVDGCFQKQELNITEIFYSIEGEGREAGMPKTFIRVKGCPHKCSFCDSKYSIGVSRNLDKKYKISLKDIIKKVEKMNTRNIEFTGGSPDYFPFKIGYLLAYFKTHHNSRIAMQVSGGIDTTKSFPLFTHSDINCFDCKDPRENIPFVIEDRYIRECDEIKFLIRDDASYNFVKNKIKEFLDRGLKCAFIITTETNNKEDVIEDHVAKLRELTNKILNDPEFPKSNIRILQRLHVMLWGNKKGV